MAEGLSLKVSEERVDSYLVGIVSVSCFVDMSQIRISRYMFSRERDGDGEGFVWVSLIGIEIFQEPITLSILIS